jgi:hypothetical protein
MAVSSELCRYIVDVMGVQEVKRDGSGTEAAGEYTLWT